MSELKLKNCPYCGGEPETIIRGNEHTAKRFVIIKCKKCRIALTTSGILSPLATLMTWSIERWNRRTPDVNAELVEALKQIEAISYGLEETTNDCMAVNKCGAIAQYALNKAQNKE